MGEWGRDRGREVSLGTDIGFAALIRSYIEGPLNVRLGGQERLADEPVVVALLERLRSIRDIATVAEDRQLGAHTQSCVLPHALRQHLAVVVVRILPRHARNAQRVVLHDLHPIVDRTLPGGQERGVLVPQRNVLD